LNADLRRFAWKRARLLSLDAPVEEHKQAFEICEREIRSGLQIADPRVIDDLSRTFFELILQIPYFQDRILLTLIFKSQVSLALCGYPAVERTSSAATAIASSLLRIPSSVVSYFGPIVVYDFPAITQRMVQDGSQSNIFFTLSNRFENRHPAILEAFAEVPRWVDRQVLLNVGFIDRMCKLLGVDQESQAVLSLPHRPLINRKNIATSPGFSFSRPRFFPLPGPEHGQFVAVR
jgi:hypothetical protein